MSEKVLLIDDDPKSTQEPPRERFVSLARFRETVRRDLECLLNSCRNTDFVHDDYRELPTSVLAFGLQLWTALAGYFR